MTRIAFMADVHASNHRQHGGQIVAGINQRGRTIVDAVTRAASAATQMGAKATVVLGDLFDTVRPPPPLITAVGRALEGAPSCHVILGNHDRASDGFDDNAVAPISLSNSVYVVQSPEVRRVDDAELVLVPYMPGAARQWLPGVLEGMSGSFAGSFDSGRVLCLHLGIWDEQTPSFLKDAHDSVPLEMIKELSAKYRFSAVVAGNWHQRRAWKHGDTHIFIAGTTAPVNHGDEKSDGKMIILEVAMRGRPTQFMLVDVPGPRWATANGIDGLQGVVPPPTGCHLYVRSAVLPSQFAEARALKDSLESSGSISVNITIDSTVVKSQARKAAEVARSAESFEEVAAEYLGEFPVREPGTRAGVAKRVAEYRHQAR